MTSKQTVAGATSSGCDSQDDVFPTHAIDENNNWVEWEEFVQSINPASASVPIMLNHQSSLNEKHPNNSVVPIMPCVNRVKDEHRERLGGTFGGNGI